MTTKPSTCNLAATSGWVRFVDAAPVRGRTCVLPQEICAVHGRAMLGGGRPPPRPHKAIDKLKDRVCELSRRTRGHRLDTIVVELRDTPLGWCQ